MRTRHLMTSILLITSSVTSFTAAAFSPDTSNARVYGNEIYGNEKAITFKANDGQTTNAFSGSLKVPENYFDKNSRQIEIGYVRFPATGKEKGYPIIYLSGGPGGSGIETAKWRRYPLFMALREFGDVIALDQRGTGVTNQLPECISEQVIPMQEKISNQEITSRYRKAAKECFAFWESKDIDPLGYTTRQNALDLDSLRKHFQADKINLWGISYGSHLAFAAMNEFGEKINKVIIASAEGLNQTVKLPALTDKYFQRIQGVIDQQPELKNHYPDLKGLISRVHRKLEDSPILMDIPTTDGDPKKLLFQKGHMQMLASMVISDPGENLAMLLALYKQLDAGETQILSMILSKGIFNDSSIKFKLMSLAMDVASGITNERLQQVNQQAKTSLLGSMLNFPMPHLNQVIPEFDLGDKFRVLKKSDVPTLLFTGSLDGRTYPEAQKEAVKEITQLTHITVENAGHNLFTASPKVLQAMQQFLKGEKIEENKIVLPLPKLQMRR